MATYATQEEFEAYVEGWTTTDAPALERLLVRAERDIDAILGDPASVQANGLKFGDPKGANELALTTHQVAQLSRATCAQGYYRFLKESEDFFFEGQLDFVSGPDFSTRGTLPRISPQTLVELRLGGLLAYDALVIG